MYLLERLVGISCYLIALFFAFFMIYYKKAKIKNVLCVYAIMLVVMAYFYEPPESADLYRIGQIMETLSQYNFKSFSKIFLINNSCPAAYCLYWLIGKVGNTNLLPAIVTLITYTIVFYILRRSSEMYGLGNQGVALILLFVMSTGNYLMVISNIRTMLAITLLCLCFFRESVLAQFKIWHIPLYILSALIHNLAFVLLIVRCLIFVISSNAKIRWKALSVIIFTIVSVYTVLNYEWLFDAVFEKALEYLTGDYYSYVWEYIIAFLALVLEVVAVTMYIRNREKKLKELQMFLILCLSIALFCVTEFSIFHRLITYIAPILTIPILAVGLSKNHTRYITGNSTLFLSIVMLLIACFRGSLSSLKFFAI